MLDTLSAKWLSSYSVSSLSDSEQEAPDPSTHKPKHQHGGNQYTSELQHRNLVATPRHPGQSSRTATYICRHIAEDFICVVQRRLVSCIVVDVYCHTS